MQTSGLCRSYWAGTQFWVIPSERVGANLSIPGPHRAASGSERKPLAMHVNMRRVRQLAVFAAAGAAMVLGSAAASAAPSVNAAAPPPNASAGVDTNLRITGLDGPNTLMISRVLGQNAFLVTDTAPIKALPGCGVVTVPNGLFGVQCRALTSTSGAFKTVIVNAGGGNDVVTNN